MEYSLSIHPKNGLVTIVATTDDVVKSFIEDETNADYQQYLVDTNGGLPLPKETK